MIRILTAAAALVLCAAPAWAIGCVVEPSPVNCTGGMGTMPMYQPAPVYQPAYQVPMYRPSYMPPPQDDTAQQLQQLNHMLGAQERARNNFYGR